MQFIPAPVDTNPYADTTFCNFQEHDPVDWDEKYIGVIEEYVTCLGAKELLKSGRERAEIIGLITALGVKYNQVELMADILTARTSIVVREGLVEDISNDERSIIEFISTMTPMTFFMSRLRLIALNVIKEKDQAAYEVKKAIWLQNYERIKFIFEMFTAKVLSPPIYICIEYETSPYITCHQKIEERNMEHLKHMYRDLYYVCISDGGGCRKEQFLPRWVADEHKRTYKTCCFDPQCTKPNNFNTFFGFRGEGLPAVINVSKATAHLNLILDHIKNVYCNGNQEHADYLIKWFANIIKYPWHKSEVLVLIFGIEGCGKGIVIDFFARSVIGDYLSFQTASAENDLFSKFAVGSHRKLFCFCDEAGDDLKKYHDGLKNLITAKTIRVEKKGQDIRTELNFTNVIVASNNDSSVYVSCNDRRVVAFQCDEIHKDDHAYFDQLVEATENEECARLMFDYLKNYDLPENYHFQANRPVTKYYESLQAASLSVFWRFFSYQCVTKGSESNLVKYTAKALYTEFLDWKTERGYEGDYNEQKFGRDMSGLIGMKNSGVVKAKRGCICYDIRYDILQTCLIRKKKIDEDAF